MIEMIEKWKDEKDRDEIRSWCMKVKQELKEYHTDNKHYMGYLSIEEFEDELGVVIENGNLKVQLDENSYETTDARDSNISVVKIFVQHELPYYTFDRKTDSPDADHGFVLIFKLKEVGL